MNEKKRKKNETCKHRIINYLSSCLYVIPVHILFLLYFLLLELHRGTEESDLDVTSTQTPALIPPKII